MQGQGYNQPPNNNFNQPIYNQPPNYGYDQAKPGMPGMPQPSIGMPNPMYNVPLLGVSSCYTACQYCQNSGYTRVQKSLNGNGCIFLILLIILFWPLFWLVFMCESNYEVRHYCSRCNGMIGKYQPS